MACRFAVFAMRLGAIFACAATLAFGANGEYSHRIWGLEDGLPNGRIQSITQTSDGYLWIGTAGGLVRFDGLRFVIFDRSNTPELADDSVLSLLAARNGSLWIGTEGGGLVHYSDNRFTRYGSQNGLTNLFVRSLLEDRKGNLWVGTDRGLFRKQNETLLRLDGTPQIPYVSALHMLEEPSGDILVGGNSLYKIQSGQLIVLAKQRVLRAILPRPDGKKWLASIDGLFVWDGARLVRIHPEITIAARMLAEPGGATWIGTDNGLYKADSSKVLRHPESSSLPDNAILSLYSDREENIWVGTRNGLARLSRNLATILPGDGDDAVFSISRDRSNRVWLAGGNGKLSELVNGRLLPRQILGVPRGASIRTVFEDRNGCFWVGTASEGFFRTGCGPVQVFNTAAGLRNNTIRAFVQDRAGDLWVGTGSGLARLSASGLKVFYTDEGLAYGSVRCVLEDRNGDLWVGTDGGLSRMRNGKFVLDATTKALAGERIWALHQDSNGALWVGTRGRGLFRIDSTRVFEFKSDAGLPTSIYQILEDTAGNLWMSGPSGIVRAKRLDLDKAASGGNRVLKVVAYGSAEGIASVQMSGGFQPAGAISPEGKVWFASVKGAVGIDSDILPSIHLPTTFIEKVSLDGRAIDLAEELRIPPDTTRMDIQFTAPSLLSPDRIQFWYRLENFDRDWIYASTNRSASYTSLPPGRYTFRLMARNRAAPDEPSEANVKVIWEPHFFQTRAAWVLMALITLAVAGLGLWLYARQTRQRYAVLLAERARLAREMHDTVIQGCVGVSSLLEAAASFERTNPSMLVDLLNRARSQVRLTLEEARQAVWDLRQDSTTPFPARLTEFAAHLSDETGVAIEVQIEGDPVELDSEADRNLFAATREAVRNAVTHGKPKSVKVLVSYSSVSVRIEVEDDGIGFEPGTPRSGTGHYGLLGMRERMEHLGGSLRLLSDHSRGTRVIAELPLSDGGRE